MLRLIPCLLLLSCIPADQVGLVERSSPPLDVVDPDIQRLPARYWSADGQRLTVMPLGRVYLMTGGNWVAYQHDAVSVIDPTVSLGTHLTELTTYYLYATPSSVAASRVVAIVVNTSPPDVALLWDSGDGARARRFVGVFYTDNGAVEVNAAQVIPFSCSGGRYRYASANTGAIGSPSGLHVVQLWDNTDLTTAQLPAVPAFAASARLFWRAVLLPNYTFAIFQAQTTARIWGDSDVFAIFPDGSTELTVGTMEYPMMIGSRDVKYYLDKYVSGSLQLGVAGFDY